MVDLEAGFAHGAGRKKGRPRKRPPFLRLRTALGVRVQAEQDKRLAGMQAQ